MTSLVPRGRFRLAALFTSLLGFGFAACSGTEQSDVRQTDNGLTGFNVLTRAYSNQRTGVNSSESILTPSNVNSSQFGKLFQVAVDDEVYAGILYVSNLQIAGGTHNVFYVATVNNTVSAFDADVGGAPLWTQNFNGTGRPTMNGEVGQGCGVYRDFGGNIGIVGTPVIDGSTQTIYFVTRTVEGSATVQRLHALNIATGAEQPNSPQVIAGSVPGTGSGSVGGVVTFDPVVENQRPGLALANGVVYIAWSSFCDTGNYHGWTMGYDATTLAQTGQFNLTPTGSQAGVWMGGAAPSFDSAGNLYLSSGNGSFDGTTNFGESLIKLAPRTLGLLDYFTPSNFDALNSADNDFGSSGPLFLPGTDKVITGAKEGKAYLAASGNLGHLGDGNATQVFQAVDLSARPTDTHHIHNAMVAWNSPSGTNLYVWGENDFLRAYHFNGTTFDTPAAMVGSVLPPFGMPGGMISLSANGAVPGTGILWATTPRTGDANQSTVPGAFYAFNAETLALLWQSSTIADDPQLFAKFNPPVVANGKVYVASFSHLVSVYGGGVPPSADLALNKPTTGSTPCGSAEGPDKAVNGSLNGGNSDKWCSHDSLPSMQIDLGAVYSVNKIIVSHAAAGGELAQWNTRDFNLQVSTDGSTFTTVADVAGNTADATTHNFQTTSARYVRLNIITPTSTSDTAARIYEVEVYGPSGGGGNGSGGAGGTGGTGGAGTAGGGAGGVSGTGGGGTGGGGAGGGGAGGGGAGGGGAGGVSGTGGGGTSGGGAGGTAGAGTGGSSGDLALNRPVVGSTPCSSSEGPEKAVNGSVSGGNSDKWCSAQGSASLRIDLGAITSITQIVVKHAGAGGENIIYNTKAYNLQVSTDGTTFSTVVTVTGNTASVTTHNISAVSARYVRLNIVTPTSGGDSATRIYEVEVYGAGGGGGTGGGGAGGGGTGGTSGTGGGGSGGGGTGGTSGTGGGGSGGASGGGGHGGTGGTSGGGGGGAGGASGTGGGGAGGLGGASGTGGSSGSGGASGTGGGGGASGAGGSGGSTDLALNKPVTGSTPCSSSEGPEKAVNGSVSGGNSDKWCSTAGSATLRIDLGAVIPINQIIVKHAGAGGENVVYNTKAYNLQVSTDGTTYTTVVTVTGNTASITTHNLATTSARYVRLNIVIPSSGDSATRIYEIEVRGP